jgi:hypothetical protein
LRALRARLLSTGLLNSRLLNTGLLNTRLLYARLLNAVLLHALAVVVPLARCRPLGNLLTMHLLPCLLLFALRKRRFSLLAIDLALLSFTNLPITVRTHPLGERVPIEDRTLHGRSGFADGSLGARRAILSIADHDVIGNAANGAFTDLAAESRTIRALRRLRQSRVWRRAPCKSRCRGGRIASDYHLAINDRLRGSARVGARRPAKAALAAGCELRRDGTRRSLCDSRVVSPDDATSNSPRSRERGARRGRHAARCHAISIVEVRAAIFIGLRNEHAIDDGIRDVHTFHVMPAVAM